MFVKSVVKEGLNMDNLFKALLIIILVAFLYLYYENSENGRYIKYYEVGLNVLDTTTGELYFHSEDRDVVIDLISGTTKSIGTIKF